MHKMKHCGTAYDRLNDEYKILCLISQGDMFDKMKMAELVGKITFAVEYGHITQEQWNNLFCKIYKAVNGENPR